MRRVIYAACAALLLTGASSSTAHADGHDTDDGVSISAYGIKLHVDKVSGAVDAHTRARAQLYVFTPGENDHRDITGWKRGTKRTAGLTKLTVYEWRLDRSLPNNIRLCMRVEDRNGVPCVTIHR